MKKTILILTVTALMLCLFTLAVGAERVMPEIPEVTHTYYLVQDADSALALSLTSQGLNVVAYKDMISNVSNNSSPFFNTNKFAEGSHIELIFAEDIFVSQQESASYQGVLINKKYVVTFRYNGFTHVIDCPADSVYNGIYVNNGDAIVRFIGTKAIDGENGSVSSSFNAPVIENGAVDLSGCNLDAYKTNGEYIRGKYGQIYVENLRAFSKTSVVFTLDPSNYTYYFYDCAFDSETEKALRLEGTSGKVVYVDNGYYDGFVAYSAKTPSTIKNATLRGDIHIDTWNLSGQVIRFENCDINVGRISSSTGRTHYVFYHCDMNEDITWGLSGDGGGNQYVRIYSAPTCTEGGKLTFKGSSSSVPSSYKAEVEPYAASNPALGHIENEGWYVVFDGAEYLSSYSAVTGCPRCGEGATETRYGSALMTVYGYSVPLYGAEVSVSFFVKLNRSAIEEYEELTGTEIECGIVAAAKSSIGEGVLPFDENGNGVSDKVIKVNASELLYSPYVEFKVGMTEEHVDTELLICAYIIEKDEEGVKISYIQENITLVEDNSFTYVSYNGLK